MHVRCVAACVTTLGSCTGSLPAIMALMDKNPDSTDEQGDSAVCFCMAAALAGLILDEDAMQAVVQRQEAAPLFQNCLSLLARTLKSLEPQAEVMQLQTLQIMSSSCPNCDQIVSKRCPDHGWKYCRDGGGDRLSWAVRAGHLMPSCSLSGHCSQPGHCLLCLLALSCDMLLLTLAHL